MTFIPSYKQRRARRRFMRLAFYWIVGGVAGGLMYLVLGIYASFFL